MAHKKITRKEEYALDENGNRISAGFGYKTIIKQVETKPYKKIGMISIVAGVFFGVLFTFFGCISSVTTGNTGVVTTFGKVENYTLEAGFHLKAPWHTVTEMDNRVQKTTIELSCFSADIQEVSMKYTLNYQIDKANAQEIYKTVGTNYYATIIEPTIAEAVKVAAAKYTAEQLVQTRSNLAGDIEALLETNLSSYNIKVSSTAIEDMDFTDAFTNAVEAKQVAAQNKLKAEIEQAQKVIEQEAAARRAVIDAEAAAEVARIQAQADLEVTKIQADAAEYAGQKEAAKNQAVSESLTEELLKYYYINQWNGVLPDTYVGSDDVSTIISGTKNSD
jgi:regulator of protease activity HflC (stomatin/prohibitin superfamily)